MSKHSPPHKSDLNSAVFLRIECLSSSMRIGHVEAISRLIERQRGRYVLNVRRPVSCCIRFSWAILFGIMLNEKTLVNEHCTLNQYCWRLDQPLARSWLCDFLAGRKVESRAFRITQRRSGISGKSSGWRSLLRSLPDCNGFLSANFARRLIRYTDLCDVRLPLPLHERISTLRYRQEHPNRFLDQNCSIYSIDTLYRIDIIDIGASTHSFGLTPLRILRHAAVTICLCKVRTG